MRGRYICLCPWSKEASYADACPDPGIWAFCKEESVEGHEPRSGTRGALLRLTRSAPGGTSPGIFGKDGLGLAECFGARRTQVRRRARGVPLHVGPVRRIFTRVGRGPVWVKISYPRQRAQGVVARKPDTLVVRSLTARGLSRIHGQSCASRVLLGAPPGGWVSQDRAVRSFSCPRGQTFPSRRSGEGGLRIPSHEVG